MIKLKNININYADKMILKDVNMTVSAGDFNYLIGSSGSGKTTLLKLLSGRIKDFQGQFLFNNIDLAQANVLDRNNYLKQIVYLPHFSILDENLTISEQCQYLLELNSNQNRVEKWEEIEKICMLSDFANSFPSECSGGQKNKAALALALCAGMEILFLDEPTAALDPVSTDNYMRLLEQLNENGLTIIMVSHDYSLLKQFPHRAYKIEEGKLFEL